MVEKWKLALKEFLSNYENNEDVVGAVLCGSYATGNNNDNSDIDVYLVLKNSCNYQRRGNTECNSYLIEYFMNPVWKIKDYMIEEFDDNCLCTISMFAYGKVIYDTDGSVEILQRLALNYLDKNMDVITSKKQDSNNYHIWDYLDELKVCLDNDSDDFNMIYNSLLYDVYKAYSKYLSIPIYPMTKLYRILTDEDYRKKYHVYKLPEKEFLKLYLKCYEVDKFNIMYKNIKELIDYYFNRQGGFNIRTFSIENELRLEYGN